MAGKPQTHSKLVRRAIPNAILELKYLQQNDPRIGEALSDLDFNVSPQEEKILALAAWLHDIGKATATTIDDRPWHEPGPPGKIRSIGHQDAEHYKPQLERLRQYAPPETIQLYLDNQELVNFLIEHHMDLMNGQFSRKFIAENFEKGKVKNTPQMKLLLILMWTKWDDVLRIQLLRQLQSMLRLLLRQLKLALE